MKNKRTAVAGISVLGAIGVISTGFAGWVITMPSQDGSGNGTISADGDVQTNGAWIDKDASKFDDATIYYGPNKASVTNGWLSATVTKQPKLTTTYTLALKYQNVTTITIKDIKVEEIIADGGSSVYQPLLTSKYVDALPTLKSAKEENRSSITVPTTANSAKVDADNGTLSFTVTKVDNKVSTLEAKFDIAFGWGKKSSYLNPMDYYNGEGHSAEQDQAEATAYIGAMKALSDTKYRFSYTVLAA